MPPSPGIAARAAHPQSWGEAGNSCPPASGETALRTPGPRLSSPGTARQQVSVARPSHCGTLSPQPWHTEAGSRGQESAFTHPDAVLGIVGHLSGPALLTLVSPGRDALRSWRSFSAFPWDRPKPAGRFLRRLLRGRPLCRFSCCLASPGGKTPSRGSGLCCLPGPGCFPGFLQPLDFP